MTTSSAFPVAWKTSAVRSFCEIPFEPGSKYSSIEVQRVEVRGIQGYLALLRRSATDTVDVLAEPNLKINKAWVRSEPATAHEHIGTVASTTFKKTQCLVSGSECNVRAIFKDVDGQVVNITVTGLFPTPSRPVFRAAPAQSDPNNLRFLIMDVFHFLPRGSNVKVLLDGQAQAQKDFLHPSKISAKLSIRVGGSLLLAGLSFAQGPGAGEHAVSADGSRCRIERDDLWFELRFDPPLPTAKDLSGASARSGTAVVNSPLGQVAYGTWQVSIRNGNRTFRIVDLTQEWDPKIRGNRTSLWGARRPTRTDETWAFSANDDTENCAQWDSNGHWKVKRHEAQRIW